jgi:hypothetical protein
MDATCVWELTHRKSWPNEAIEDMPFTHDANLYHFLVGTSAGFKIEARDCGIFRKVDRHDLQ